MQSWAASADSLASARKGKDSRSSDLRKVLACLPFDLVGKRGFGVCLTAPENMPGEQRAPHPPPHGNHIASPNTPISP